MAIQERTWKNETCDAEVHVCARRSGAEVDKSCIPHDKVSYIRSTHERLCDDRIETRLKQNQEAKVQREKKSISSDEVEMRTSRQVKKCEIKTKCPELKGGVRRITQVFLVKFSAIVFINVK